MAIKSLHSSNPVMGISKVLLCFVAMIAISLPTVAQNTHEDGSRQTAVSKITAAEITSAQQFGQSPGIADWLGPLAPVALSPFFGIACLSGMAILGQGWMAADNPFLGESSPLNNHAIFGTFLVLTLITSLPRLTKVSKPFAQAVDQVEAWAGIITMLTLKIMLEAQAPETAELGVIHLGIISFTIDTLLLIAAAINVFVINTVKFFFEMLIWITPIPAIDAIFEFANKSLCAILMAVYGYSPTIATGINLAIFVAAAIIFSWSYRREVFFRTVLIDALWAFFSPAKTVTNPQVIVFPTCKINVIPARARCILSKTDTGWKITQQRLLRHNVEVLLPSPDCRMTLNAGYFTNCLKLNGSHSGELTFSRRHNACLAELSELMGATLNANDAVLLRNQSDLKAELSS